MEGRNSAYHLKYQWTVTVKAKCLPCLAGHMYFTYTVTVYLLESSFLFS